MKMKCRRGGGGGGGVVAAIRKIVGKRKMGVKLEKKMVCFIARKGPPDSRFVANYDFLIMTSSKDVSPCLGMLLLAAKHHGVSNTRNRAIHKIGFSEVFHTSTFFNFKPYFNEGTLRSRLSLL